MPDAKLNVEILTPLKTLYKNDAIAISSQNNKGTFDILPEHGPFISIINKSLTVTDTNSQKQEFQIETAVLECFDNKIRIFIGFQ